MADDDRNQTNPPRRDFLGVALTGSAAALGVMTGYPVIRYLSPPTGATPGTAVVGPIDDFPRGSGRTLLLGERPALIMRLEDGSFRAYIALCSHLGCVVAYAPQRKQIECACHRGVYSLEGENVSGPPPRPLAPLMVTVVNGVITVSEV